MWRINLDLFFIGEEDQLLPMTYRFLGSTLRLISRLQVTDHREIYHFRNLIQRLRHQILNFRHRKTYIR